VRGAALTIALVVAGCTSGPPEPEPSPAAEAEAVVAPAHDVAAPISAGDLDPPEVMGLAAGAGRGLVIAHCTACHSTALVTQNRMSRARWDDTITWMQETQNLWPIPAAQRSRLLDYLAKTQGPIAHPPGVNGPPVYPPNPIW